MLSVHTAYRRSRPRGAGLLGVCAAAVCVSADSPDSMAHPLPSDSVAPASLGEIVVTARRPSFPSTVFEITRAQIDGRGARNVAEAVETVPGVTVSVGRKNEVAVRLRGADPKRVLVLVDGRPINMPYYGKIDLRTVPVDRIERVKVVLGAGSLLYGPNAAGGVINIITRRGAGLDAIAAVVDINVSPYALKQLYDDGTYGARASCFGELGFWNWSASVSADHGYGFALSDDYNPPPYAQERGGLRDNSDHAALNAEGSIGVRAGERVEADIAAGCHSARRGIPADIDYPEYNRFDEWRRYFLDAMTRVGIGKYGRFTGRLYYDGLSNLYVSYADAAFDSVTNRSRHENWDWGADLFGDMPVGPTTLGGSARVRQDVANIKRSDTAAWQTCEIVTASGALEDRWRLRRLPLVLTGALGASYVWRADYGEDSTSSWSIDAAGGARLNLGEWGAIHVGIGRYTRYPTIHELFSERGGNPSLAPEQSVKIDAGLEAAPFEWGRGRLSLFFERYRDLISRHVLVDGSGNRMELYYNADIAVSAGATIGADFSLQTLRSTLGVDYTLDNTRLDNLLSVAPLPYTPLHVLHLRTDTRFLAGGVLHLEGTLAADRVDTDGKALPAYFVANGTLSYTWRFIKAALAVRNIFDTHYTTEGAGYPMPGRSVELRLSLLVNAD